VTPFEKVMGVYKKAEMLIESVHHNWHYSRDGGGAIYSGSYTGLTCDVAHELWALFKEAGAWTWISARIVSVECPITDDEKVWVNKKRGYRG
jgi:hypothetical protein